METKQSTIDIKESSSPRKKRLHFWWALSALAVWHNAIIFQEIKNFQICVLGNKFVLNSGLMWYFPCYIDLVLMVLLELSSINFTWRTCYNLLGHFLMEAIMRTFKVSSKPSGSHDLPGVCKMKSLKYPVRVDIASNFQNIYKCLLISDAAAAVADCWACSAPLSSLRRVSGQWLNIIWLPQR